MHRLKINEKKLRIILFAIIGVLSAVFITASFSLVSELDRLATAGAFANRLPLRELLRRRHNPPLDENGRVRVETWMTFNYLNMAFGLPPDFLKEKLAISGKRYPNLTVGQWAGEKKIDPAGLIAEISGLIEAYRSSPPNN